jgi:hypothetical protein
MSDATRRHVLPCPHPDCYGEVAFAHALPAGLYPCPCHSAILQLAWSVPDYAYLEPRPYLALAPAQPAPPANAQPAQPSVTEV